MGHTLTRSHGAHPEHVSTIAGTQEVRNSEHHMHLRASTLFKVLFESVFAVCKESVAQRQDIE